MIGRNVTQIIYAYREKIKKKIKTEALQTTAQNATIDLIRLNLLTLELKKNLVFLVNVVFLNNLMIFYFVLEFLYKNKVLTIITN